MLKKFLALVVMLYATLAMAAVVDVNKATEAELDAIKGVGPVTSKLILSERKKGEFKSWTDFVTRVKGIGDSRAAKLSEEGLRVGGHTYTTGTKMDEKAAKKEEKAAKDDKKDAKAAAKDDKKDAKAVAKEEKREATATAKAEVKAAEAKKDAKIDKAEAKKDAKEAKADAKADAAKPAASAKK